MSTLFTPDFSGPEVAASGRFLIGSLHPLPDGQGYSALLNNSSLSIQSTIPREVHDDPSCGIALKASVQVNGLFEVNPWHLTVVSSQPTRSSVDLLPATCLPEAKHSLLAQLIKTVNAYHPYVQRYVELALGFQDQYERFLVLPASRDCHHAHVCGLLEHSLEVVEFLKLMPPVRAIADPICRDLILANGLLHDIGKTYAGVEYTSESRPAHDELTLKALSSALALLHEVWPEGEEFSRFALGRGWRQRSPSSPEVIMLRLADQLSASNDARNRAFAELPELFRFANVEYANGSQRTFRRLLPPKKRVLH